MEYSLSNSLAGGSGSINPDGLSLDLQFAADKTLTARKGPTPAFTRANPTATFVGSNGLIQTATTNIPRFLHDLSYVGSSVYVTSNDAITDSGFPLPSERADCIGIDGNGYPEFESAMYYISFSVGDGQWLLNGDGGSFTAHSDVALSDEYTTDAGTGTVSVDLTLACEGLLIEEQRTNQIKYSYNNFTNAYWNDTANNVTAVDSAEDGPDGVASGASSLTEIAGASLTRHIHETTAVFTPSANTAYTMSVWVKQAGANPVRYVQLTFFNAGFGSTAYMNYDIQAGAVGTGGAGITASSITAYPNGWYRITATATSVASPAASGFQLGFSTTSGAARTEAYTVVSPLKAIYLWGAQLEAGADATSYIPTVASSLTRSADVCSISGADFTGMWNRFAGTVVASISSMYSNSGRFVANNVGARALEIYKSGGNTLFFEASGGQEVIITNASTIPFKAGVAYSINDYQGAFNGTLGGVDTNTGGTIPNATLLTIGNLNNGNYLNGTISSIRYYKKRLPNAKLQTLTT